MPITRVVSPILSLPTRGPAGPRGPRPDHSWSGTQLRFQNPDGTWDSYVDLRGAGIQPNATGTLAQRAAYDAQMQGFVYLETDVNPFRLWVKASATSADWAGPTSVWETLGAFGVTFVASATQTAAINALFSGRSDGLTFVASDRTVLAALDPAGHQETFLNEAGYEGNFIWSSANNSASVTADVNKVDYVAPASDTTGASGAWIRKRDAGSAKVIMMGASDNQAWMARKLSEIGSQGGEIRLPPGIFPLNSQVTYTLPNARAGLKIVGAGSDVTTLHFPNASGGLQFTQGNVRNSIHLAGFSLTTAQAGAAEGIVLIAPTFPGTFSNWSSVEDITTRGEDDGAVHYWTTGVRAHGWSQINCERIATYGRTSGSPAGLGIQVEGGSGAGQYAILFNFKGCFFNCLNTGLVYGSYVQGVTVSGGCNFNAGIYGIHSLSGASGTLAQLAVSDSEFDNSAHNIFTETGVANTQVSDCLFFCKNGYSGVHMPQAFFAQIHNSWFSGQGSGGTSQGVHIDDSLTLPSQISNNIFHNLNLGIVLGASTTKVRCSDNNYNSNGANGSNTGTSNVIDF